MFIKPEERELAALGVTLIEDRVRIDRLNLRCIPTLQPDTRAAMERETTALAYIAAAVRSALGEPVDFSAQGAEFGADVAAGLVRSSPPFDGY